MAGDHAAARKVLKIWGYPQLAREVRDGKPFSNRVRRAVDCLTAGTGSHWEVIEGGVIENLIMSPPPPRRGVKAPHNRFDD
jgi:hypothetical protein